MAADASRRAVLALVAGGLCLALAMAASLLARTGALSTAEAWHALTGAATSSSAHLIVWGVRLPRVLAACACGVSLAVSGALLQAALDNDLASPQVMGINAGAGFFALAGTLLFPFSGVARQLMALVGALVSTLMVYLVARRAGAARTTLVLAGVAMSSLMSAGSNAIVTIWPKTVVDKLAFSLGGLTGTTVSQLTLSAPFMVAGLGAALLLAPGLDLLALGDETAIGLGLDVRRHRVVAIVCAATLAAAAVSVCGMLGFVGLMVPNLVRMAVRCGLRWGLPLCAIWGAVLLVTCDLLARVLFFPYELPAGLLLSLLGAPFFIMLLMRRRRPR